MIVLICIPLWDRSAQSGNYSYGITQEISNSELSSYRCHRERLPLLILVKSKCHFLHSLYMKRWKSTRLQCDRLFLTLVSVTRKLFLFALISHLFFLWLVCIRPMFIFCCVYFSLISKFHLCFMTVLFSHIDYSVVCDEIFTIFVLAHLSAFSLAILILVFLVTGHLSPRFHKYLLHTYQSFNLLKYLTSFLSTGTWNVSSSGLELKIFLLQYFEPWGYFSNNEATDWIIFNFIMICLYNDFGFVCLFWQIIY